MSRSFSDKQKAKKGARFQFELLEPRHLFSLAPFSPSLPETPLIETTSVTSALEQQADQALTNLTWLPMVFAGADKAVSVSTSLLVTGEVIINANVNLSQTWSKVSGPGNAVFGNAAAVSSSVTFDQAGTYELQLAATNGGLTSFDRVFVTVTASNTINIDQAWLNSRGAGPYYLDQQGRTYILQEDLTVEGTAFIVLNKDITFDLNGHTITYGNSAPINVVNGGFEQSGGASNLPGWTFSDPTVASRVPSRIGMWGDYMLQLTNINSTQTLTSQPIAIPLANVEYMASVAPKALYGTTVTISIIDNVTQQVLVSGTTRDTSRGFFSTATFAPTTTNPVVIRITVTPPAGQAVTVNLDYISLERSRDYGIVATPSVYNLPVHLKTATVNTNGSKTSGFTLTGGGSIVQGTGRSVGGSAVYVQSINGVTIEKTTISFCGIDTNAIMAQWANNLTVKDNQITGHADRVSDRMRSYASIMAQQVDGVVVISNNTILGATLAGIAVSRTGDISASVSIVGNTIKHEALGTDGYGIIINNVKNFTISGNVVKPTNGRGILFDNYSSGKTWNGVVENNVFESREKANLEYDGTGLEATAFRMRSYANSVDAFRNIVIRNNLCFAETGVGYCWAACAARITLNTSDSSQANPNLVFEGNTFRATLNSVDSQYGGARLPRAWALSPNIHSAKSDTIYRDNRIESNDVSLNLGDNDGYNAIIENIRFISNTFVKISEGLTMAHRSIVVGDWGATVRDVSLIGNRYENGATSQVFFIGSKVKDISLGWLLSIVVKAPSGPVSGASVEIVDTQGASVFSGTADQQGRVNNLPIISTTLRQLSANPNQITTEPRGTFSITASLGNSTMTEELELAGDYDLEIALNSGL